MTVVIIVRDVIYKFYGNTPHTSNTRDINIILENGETVWTQWFVREFLKTFGFNPQERFVLFCPQCGIAASLLADANVSVVNSINGFVILHSVC